MGQLSHPGSHAVIWCTYGFLLITGCFLAWRYGSKSLFLSSNGTQRGLPLALNFIASAMGCGILTTYAQIANVAGLHGLLVYTICGAIPILGFAAIGPVIRRRCPDGFVLTEWVRHRFGVVTALYLSLFTCLTMFLFMLAELSALKGAIETLTGLNALPMVIIECVVTSIYTAYGGFKVSFITDNFQGALVIILIIICACGMGSYIKIDTLKVGPSGLLKGNKLGWQLVYILFVAILTNDCFMSGFWLRTFALRSNKDLWIGCLIASVVVFVVCSLVGVPGMLAVWLGDLEVGDENGYNAFFILLEKMPTWLVAFIIIFIVALSTMTFDSLQSAFVSTISNDIFRNRLNIWYVRIIVVVIIVPIVVLALVVADDILKIYLIADLVSASVIPLVFLGLSDRYFYMLNGFDVMFGGLGAIFFVWVYGLCYYHLASEGGKLLLMWNGLYNSEDWGPFGAFAIAPVGGVILTIFSCSVRCAIAWIQSRVTDKPFTFLERPEPKEPESSLESYGLIDDEEHVSFQNDVISTKSKS